jgi:hypothetical protein
MTHALMAHCVGPSGRVVAIEIDDVLAAGARDNLASFEQVEVRLGPLGKGPLLALKRTGTEFDARLVTVIAIYSAVGIRDEALNERIGKALMRGVASGLTRLRRDAHDESSACWPHTDRFCLSNS